MRTQATALPKTLFPFIGHFLKGYKHIVIPYALLAFLAGFWGPFNSLLIKQLINRLPAAAQEGTGLLLIPAGLLVLNFIVLDNVTWRTITYLRYRFLPSLVNQVDSSLLNYTLQHSYQFFQERMAGTLSKQVFQCTDGVEKILSSSLCNFLRASSLLLMAFICAFQVNPIFFVILIIWGLVFFSVSFRMSRKLSILAERQAATEDLLHKLCLLVSGFVKNKLGILMYACCTLRFLSYFFLPRNQNTWFCKRSSVSPRRANYR